MSISMEDIAHVNMTSMDEIPDEEKQQEEPLKKDDHVPGGREKKDASKTRDARTKPDKGIGPRCPTIYLLPEEKTYLDRLKAFITLTTGEKPYDHMLVMTALKEYVRKNYKEFSEKYKV